MNKKLMLILCMVAVLFLSACNQGPAYEDQLDDLGETDQQVEQPVVDDQPTTDDQIVVDDQQVEQPAQEELPEVVATVNGDEILGETVSSLQTQMQMQGMELSVEDAVNQLVTQQLLIQEADDRGYSASKEDVEALFLEQGLSIEELKEMVATQGLDYDEFIEEQKGEAKYMLLIEEEKQDIEISDEEAMNFYEENQEMMGNESFEVISEDIKEHLAAQKANQLLFELADELSQTAEIEIFY